MSAAQAHWDDKMRGKAMDAAERATTCRFGDPTCPCQDGDTCHYEPLYDEEGIISQPINVPPEYALNAIRQAEQAARQDERRKVLLEAANLCAGSGWHGGLLSDKLRALAEEVT